MPVAQVPRRDLLEKHRTVVRFGVLHQAGVLLGVEELVLGHATVAARVLHGPALQLDELADHFLFARFGEAGARDETVDLRVFAEVVEAGIPLPRLPGRLGIDLLEISEHGLHRGVETVEIEAVEAGLRGVGRKCVVVRS